MNDLRLLNLQSTNLSCWKLMANPWEVNMWVQDYGSLFFMRCHNFTVINALSTSGCIPASRWVVPQLYTYVYMYIYTYK